MSEPAAPAADRRRRLEKLRYWRRACADTAPPVVSYNMSEAANPLVFFHGDFAMGGQYLRRLALKSRQPIVAIAPHGMRSGAVPVTIEEMAADKLREVKAIRAAGPYRIGGYCNGALIAYETARMLIAEGCEVEVLVLLEPSSLNVRPVYRAIHRIISLAGDPRRVGTAMKYVWSAARVARMTQTELVDLVRDLQSQRTEASRIGRDEPEERAVHEALQGLTAAYYRAIAAHLPNAVVGCDVVALSTGKDGAGRRSALYDAASWAALCPRFAHVRLPGTHSTCLSEGVDVLAGHLAEILSGRMVRDVEDVSATAGLKGARGLA